MRYWYISIFFLLFVLPLSIEAQKHQYPLRDWENVLSGKKIDSTSQAKLAAIAELPAEERCKALDHLLKRSRTSNDYAQIRTHLLYESYSRQGQKCTYAADGLKFIHEALQKAYEIEDPVLVAEIYRQLSSHYDVVRKERGPALMYLMLSIEEKVRIGEEHFAGLPYDFYELGGLLYHVRDYEAALEALLKAIRHKGNAAHRYRDTLDHSYKMFAWNTIGLTYSRLQDYDKAFEAFDNAMVYAQKTNATFWQGLIQGNKGDIFFKQGRYDSAYVLLEYDYQKSKDSIYDNAANSLQYLARITSIRGDSRKALAMLRESERLLSLDYERGHKLNLYYAYAMVFKELQNADSAFHYYEKFSKLQDTIEVEAAGNRTDILRLRLDNLENVQRILILNKEKNRIELIRNFSLALILLTTLIGFIYLNRQRLKSRLKQQEILEAKKLAEAEVKNARDQLMDFTENLREKTILVENLQHQLLNKELSEAQIERIHELSNYSILTDEDWDRFKMLFNKVYPSFFMDLLHRVPDMTNAEQRMAALIKLRLSGKDAARILGISPDSVRKSRQRLRQRLGLQADEELELFFTGDQTNT